MLAFARHFCIDTNVAGTFSTAVLYECLTREKPEMLQTYLAMYQTVERLKYQLSIFILVFVLFLIILFY